VTKPRSFRTFISPTLLRAAEDKARLTAAKDMASRCIANLSELTGEELGATDSAVGYVNTMYMTNRGVDTTWEAAQRIHEAYRKLSLRFGHKLASVGRSPDSIAPLIAAMIRRTVTDLRVGDNDTVPVEWTTTGFSVNVPSKLLGGWIEVGTVDGEFGAIRAYPGQTYRTENGNATDLVRVAVIREQAGAARAFDDAVTTGDADTVVAMVGKVVADVTAAPWIFRDACRRAKAEVAKAIMGKIVEVKGGSAKARASVIASRGGDAVQAAMPQGAEVAVTAHANPVPAPGTTALIVSAVVVEASSATAAITDEAVDAACASHDTATHEELERQIAEDLAKQQAELARVDAEIAAAKKAEDERRDAQALRDLEAEEAAKADAEAKKAEDTRAASTATVAVAMTVMAAAATAPAPKPEKGKRRTWYNAITGETKRAVNRPGEGWVSERREIPVGNSTTKVGNAKKAEAIAKEIAIDDAVASAVAHDPEAKAVMEKIEAEKQRRAAATPEVVDAVVMTADEVVEAKVGVVDATAEVEKVAEAATK
jgi:hypothetical protein